MIKFVAGIVIGALLSFTYVRYGVELPAVLRLPDVLRGNLVATAVEQDLYDLDRTPAERTRALEVYFANRAGDAAALDADAGAPFLSALYRTRARREARQLLLAQTAHDGVLAKPALRAALERKHGTSDRDALKQLMLAEALEQKPFLKRWLAAQGVAATPETLVSALRTTARSGAGPLTERLKSGARP